MHVWEKLPKPIFVLAPMDDVTDTVFRRVVAACAPPDLFFTEFVNVDALQSKGRESTLKRLMLGPNEGVARVLHTEGVQGAVEKRTESYKGYDEGVSEAATPQSTANATRVTGSAGKQGGMVQKPWPIIAQVWGLNLENFRRSAAEIAEMGYDGIDLNFGCPDKNVVRNGACAAFMKPENRERAVEIIQATREGAPSLPLSVKTRLGFSEVDLTWHELLLNQKLNALIIHGRTRKQMSKVPADWSVIGRIAEMRASLSPATKIIGNGDVLTKQQGQALAEQYALDGIMIGRGVFQDPFVFADDSPWSRYTKQQRIELYTKHVKLFAETWGETGRKIHTLNKFCKIYIQAFPGAKELREKFMAAQSTDELLSLLRAEK